jgi:hypothetical protein
VLFNEFELPSNVATKVTALPLEYVKVKVFVCSTLMTFNAPGKIPSDVLPK